MTSTAMTNGCNCKGIISALNEILEAQARAMEAQRVLGQLELAQRTSERDSLQETIISLTHQLEDLRRHAALKMHDQLNQAQKVTTNAQLEELRQANAALQAQLNQATAIENAALHQQLAAQGAAMEAQRLQMDAQLEELRQANAVLQEQLKQAAPFQGCTPAAVPAEVVDRMHPDGMLGIAAQLKEAGKPNYSCLASPRSTNILAPTILSDGTMYRDGALLLCAHAKDPHLRAVGFWALGRSMGNDRESSDSGAARAMAERSGTIVVNDTAYSKNLCFVMAVNLDTRFALAWYSLGSAISSAEPAIVNGKTYSKNNCYVMTLESDPSFAPAWNRLGSIMLKDETIIVDGKSYSKKECFVMALESEPSFPSAWLNLASVMGAKETIIVNGKTFLKRDCLITCLHVDPMQVSAWFNLAGIMGANETAIVCGKTCSKKDCLITCLHLVPKHVPAWYKLAAAMKAEDSVIINGKTYSKKTCHETALSLDKNSKPNPTHA